MPGYHHHNTNMLETRKIFVTKTHAWVGCLWHFTPLPALPTLPPALKFDSPIFLYPCIRMNLNADDGRNDTDISDGSEFGAAISQGVMPELYVGLAYSGTTGRLAVEIIKGSHFK